jgi:hypothetical protein
MNEELSLAVYSYLCQFNKIKKNGNKTIHNGSNGYKNRKALVINDNNYIDLIKSIEAICNDLDYKIIRLDELENQKNNKLNRISEATQSQRISCLPEALNEKLKMLERIINNDSQKFNKLLNINCDIEQEVNMQYSLPSNSTCTSSDTITHYFTLDTKERTVYNIIQDNIYQLCAKKKTLILIVDSFSSEDDKTYLSGIINKISTTKCPIVILTSKL